MDDDFEFEIAPETMIDFQWVNEDEEDFLLLRVEDNFHEDGYIFKLEEDVCLDLYAFLKDKFEPRMN